MRTVFFIAALSLLISSAAGEIPPGYYNSASGLTGESLQVALYNIIKNHTVLSYTPGIWNAFYTTDVKANGKVWDMYSDVPGGTPPYEYTLGTDQCGTSGAEGQCYSREHSFPKSWFGDVSPMNTDLFHIYPVDQYVNNHRSNYPYGAVVSPTWTSLNGSKVGPCSTPGYTGTVFEPIDAYKGDFARTYFYMATRYENLIATWPAYDPNAAAVMNGTSYPAFQEWFLDMLIQWNLQDPVSAKEIARNDSVYELQNNRNPFIDHPEYVAAMWPSSTGTLPEPTNHVTGFAASAGSQSYSAIQLSWIDATGAVIPSGYLVRGSTTGFASIPVPVDGTPVPDGGLDKNTGYGVQACTIQGLDTNTIYYFKIFPYTNTGSTIDYKTSEPVPAASDTTTTGISGLQPGDIAIIEYGSVNPDKFSFITFRQLSAGTVINFTDNGFVSPATVRTGEGFLIYTAPNIVPPGTVISWHNGMNILGTGWNTNNPTLFAFNELGDQLFAFQGTWGTDQLLLYGVNAGNSGWISSGGAAATTSYFPAGLTNEVNSLTFTEKNGNYNLITAGSANALGSLAANALNWSRSNTALTTPSWPFSISSVTNINLDATVLHLRIDQGETVTVQPGIIFTVSGNITIN